MFDRSRPPLRTEEQAEASGGAGIVAGNFFDCGMPPLSTEELAEASGGQRRPAAASGGQRRPAAASGGGAAARPQTAVVNLINGDRLPRPMEELADAGSGADSAASK